jgi:hypothetical protein
MVMDRLSLALLGLLLAISAGSAGAADGLISDIRYFEDAGFTRAGILLGIPVDVASATVDPNGTLRIRLAGQGATGTSGWSAVELDFPAKPHWARRIALEGSDRQGYQLVVEFSGPVDAQVLPMPDPRLVMLRIGPPAARAMPVALAVASETPDATPRPTAISADATPVEAATAGSGPEDLEAQARAASAAGDYDTAIRLYTRLVASTEGEQRQRALEMLGVARESNRQLAHAKALYESYLREYPDSEGARRVQQRLAALVAIERPRNSPRRRSNRKEAAGWELSSYLSQFYQRQSIEIDGNTSVPIEGVFSDAGVFASRNGSNLDQEVRVSVSHLLDFSELESLDGREYQVGSLYWDGFSNRLRSGIRIGRQSRSRAGVLGRFDGAVITHRPNTNLSLDISGGLLLDYSFEGPDPDRPFFGVSGEWVSDSGAVSFAPFFVQQDFDGVLDRRAVGLQSRMQSGDLTLFSLVDYDLHYSELNNVSLTGNFRVGRSEASAAYEHRKSPYLTTRNALIGQPYDDLSDLERAILDLQLEDIASDRTATSETARFALTTPLSEHWAVTADVVVSDFSSTETSADVIGLEPYETVYSSIQIRSTDLFGDASYSALMLRHADSDTSGTTSLYWDNRFGLGEHWWVYPRLRVDHRSFDQTDDTQWTTRPSLRLDFRYTPRMRFEIETGYWWTEREFSARSLDITGLFLRAGYHASF